jgi:hypothetical protein
MAQNDWQGDRGESGWVTGGVFFAAAAMIVIGFFQLIAGIAAIAGDEFFVITANYTFDLDTTAWGWVHLILGIIILFAGVALFSGAVWAGAVALTLAILSAIANFFFIPYYPFWSIVVIALDIWVIWAISRAWGTLGNRT